MGRLRPRSKTMSDIGNQFLGFQFGHAKRLRLCNLKLGQVLWNISLCQTCHVSAEVAEWVSGGEVESRLNAIQEWLE